MFSLARAKIKKYAPDVRVSEDRDNSLLVEFMIGFSGLDLTNEFNQAGLTENPEEDTKGEWLDEYQAKVELELDEKVRDLFNRETLPQMDLESASTELSLHGHYPNPGFGTEIDSCSGTINIHLNFNLDLLEWSSKVDVLLESLRLL